MNKGLLKRIVIVAVVAGGVAAAAWYGGFLNGESGPKAFASGNGRLETTEVNIATKLPGRLREISVEEGDMVEPGEVLARLDTHELEARLKQAQAHVQQARQNRAYAKAVVAQRKSELALAEKNLQRSESLYVNKNISLVQLQQHETALKSAKAGLAAARAQVVSSDASIKAAEAEVETIQVNIDDCTLRSSVRGRVLYRLSEPGEVLGGGGKVVTLLKLDDVFMTIFLPTSEAGRVMIGSEARIVLDAYENVAIPATVSFVSPQAQFTPKEIETANEREKLMFRIKVKVDEALLREHMEKVKTGLPGVAYVRLDETTPWPPALARVPAER